MNDIYDKEFNNNIADHLERYLELRNLLFIMEGKKKKDIENAEKTVQKYIKRLRKNKPEKVYDLDNFDEYMDN